MKNNNEQVDNKPVANINGECSLRTNEELRREIVRLKKKLNTEKCLPLPLCQENKMKHVNQQRQ